MHYLLFVMLLLSLTGCKPRWFVESDPSRKYEDRWLLEFDTEQYSQIIWDYATELKHDKFLNLEQAYVCMNSEATTIHLEFITQDILEMCEARILLVEVVDGFLDRFNHSKAIGKIAYPYPMTEAQLELYINFESYYGIYVDPFYIGWIALEDGIAHYYAFTLKNQKLDLFNVRSEPFFKSRSFVHFEKDAEQRYRLHHPELQKNKRGPIRNLTSILTPSTPQQNTGTTTYLPQFGL